MIRLAKGGKQPENSMLPFPEYACHGGGEWAYLPALTLYLTPRIPCLDQGTSRCRKQPPLVRGDADHRRASMSLLSVLSLSLVCPSSKTIR